MANEIQEIRYQVGEAWKGTYNVATVYGNAAVVQDPTGLSVYRSLKPGNVGHPLTDTSWWFCIINLSSIKEAADSIAATDAEVEAHEAARVSAEQQRVSQETARVNAETARIQAEQTRASQESARISQEQTRVNQEQVRVAQEETRRLAENSRLQAEEQRVSKETQRVNAEQQRALAEQNRVAAEQERVNDELDRVANEQNRLQRAEQDHQTAVQDNAQMTALVERADADHVQAAADHTTAVSDHTTATADHTTAAADHTTAQADHTTATEDHTASVAATAAANEAAENANALEERLLSGEVVPAQAADIESWKDTSALVPYIHKTAQETTGGDISIRSDVQARLDGIVPTSRRWKATKLVACGTNLLRQTSQTGGIATTIGTGIYFPCPALTFGTYGTAQENNGVVFTDSDNAFLTPTVYMKRIADGVPTSVTDGVQAQTVSGQNGETFYVNPASLSGEAVYVIVSDITLASSCAHIAWSGNGTPYNYYIAPDAEAPTNIEIALASLLTAIGNDGYLTQVGGVGDMLLYEDNTHMRCTRRNGRVQPTWTTEAEEIEGTPTGNYIHTATIGNMLSDGAAELEADGTRLQVSGTEVSYTDQSDTATTDYVLYNLATETSSVVAVSPMLTVNDFGLIVLLGNDGTADTTIGYAQGIADSVRALMTGGYDEVNRVIAEALNALHADNVRLAALVMELEKKTTPLTSATAGAPSAANTPEGWNADRYGPWQGWPAYVGQEYIDTASQKLYKALAHTGSVSDWVVMN